MPRGWLKNHGKNSLVTDFHDRSCVRQILGAVLLLLQCGGRHAGRPAAHLCCRWWCRSGGGKLQAACALVRLCCRSGGGKLYQTLETFQRAVPLPVLMPVLSTRGSGD